MNAFVLQHIPAAESVSGIRTLGVYSSKDTAQAAQRKFSTNAEFQRWPGVFQVTEFSVDDGIEDVTPDGQAPVGSVGWIDLTVDDCEGTRSFYEQVVGWHSSAVSLGDYEDYCVHPEAGADPVAGICHARGPNADLPPSWIIYLTVTDLEESLRTCESLGGTILQKRAPDSYGHIAVIQDPAGAACALYQPR